MISKIQNSVETDRPAPPFVLPAAILRPWYKTKRQRLYSPCTRLASKQSWEWGFTLVSPYSGTQHAQRLIPRATASMYSSVTGLGGGGMSTPRGMNSPSGMGMPALSLSRQAGVDQQVTHVFFACDAYPHEFSLIDGIIYDDDMRYVRYLYGVCTTYTFVGLAPSE